MQRKAATEEDTWGMMDYSLQNSVRIISSNPDMKNTNTVSCACGELINRTTDWHVMIANGTLICRACAKCSSCSRDNASANRRLVCIDGLVLCYPCLSAFGYFVEPVIRVRIQDPNRLLPEQSESGNNAGKAEKVVHEYERTDRCKYAPKADERRPIRAVMYERTGARVPDERNPLITAPVYDATQGTMEKVTCPPCSEVATGSAKYVVPAMARIYHRPCFNCRMCKEPMSQGMQVAGKHFEYCNCEPPLVWCTKRKCRENRISHHENRGCWLGSLRPGGREQMDTDISSQAGKIAAAKKKPNDKKAKPSEEQKAAASDL